MDRVKTIMKNLNCTEAEAKQLLLDDKKIDKGEKLFELTAEQKKVAKQSTGTGTRTVYKFEKKEKKENPVKSAIINEIYQFLSENEQLNIEMVEITNKERQILLQIGENRYELTLVQKRKQKK